METFESKKSGRHVTTQMIEEQLIREQELTWTGAAPWIFALLLLVVMWIPMLRTMAMAVIIMCTIPAILAAVIVAVLIIKERTAWTLTKAQAVKNQAKGGNDVR